MPIARQFSVCRAKNLLICLVCFEPRPSKLAFLCKLPAID